MPNTVWQEVNPHHYKGQCFLGTLPLELSIVQPETGGGWEGTLSTGSTVVCSVIACSSPHQAAVRLLDLYGKILASGKEEASLLALAASCILA